MAIPTRRRAWAKPAHSPAPAPPCGISLPLATYQAARSAALLAIRIRHRAHLRGMDDGICENAARVSYERLQEAVAFRRAWTLAGRSLPLRVCRRMPPATPCAACWCASRPGLRATSGPSAPAVCCCSRMWSARPVCAGRAPLAGRTRRIIRWCRYSTPPRTPGSACGTGTSCRNRRRRLRTSPALPRALPCGRPVWRPWHVSPS